MIVIKAHRAYRPTWHHAIGSTTGIDPSPCAMPRAYPFTFRESINMGKSPLSKEPCRYARGGSRHTAASAEPRGLMFLIIAVDTQPPFWQIVMTISIMHVCFNLVQRRNRGYGFDTTELCKKQWGPWLCLKFWGHGRAKYDPNISKDTTSVGVDDLFTISCRLKTNGLPSHDYPSHGRK